jgi:transglutaminase-like putative cysteine protease
MKYKSILFLLCLLAVLSSCRQNPDENTLLKTLENEFDKGNFRRVEVLADSIKKVFPGYENIGISDSLADIGKRIMLDFSLTEDQFEDQLKVKIGSFTQEEMSYWEIKNWLEWKMVNGEKKYFNRAASNLVLLRNFHETRSERDSLEASDKEIVDRKGHTQAIIKASEDSFVPVIPVRMTINYTVTVYPDAVPAGETVRCWLPFPRGNHSRQQNINLLSTSSEKYILSADSSVHSTLYMEATAEKGKPVVFKESFSYQTSGQYIDPKKMKAIPYDKNTSLYRSFTSEQLPHICFSENVRYLADSISGTENEPFEVVRRIYLWFCENIPWAGALEYSVIPNIPEYVLKNRRGDCGMQTLLFMSLLRSKGIPVRWQSGWKVPPGAKNLHDWCEVYFEGVGWVPLDVSYGLQYSNDRKSREFYISGIDSYRLIVNDGIAGDLYPEKKFLRSEPFDFQRGEVEWEGGNLYFDKWDYEMEIIYN